MNGTIRNGSITTDTSQSQVQFSGQVQNATVENGEILSGQVPSGLVSKGDIGTGNLAANATVPGSLENSQVRNATIFENTILNAEVPKGRGVDLTTPDGSVFTGDFQNGLIENGILTQGDNLFGTFTDPNGGSYPVYNGTVDPSGGIFNNTKSEFIGTISPSPARNPALPPGNLTTDLFVGDQFSNANFTYIDANNANQTLTGLNGTLGNGSVPKGFFVDGKTTQGSLFTGIIESGQLVNGLVDNATIKSGVPMKITNGKTPTGSQLNGTLTSG